MASGRSFFLFVVLLGAVLNGPGIAARADEPVVVASKIDTEGALLGNLIAVALARNGVAILDKTELGPTRIVRAALIAGQVDIYPEYTGNGAFFFQRETDPAWKNPAAAYATVRDLDRAANALVWLAPSPADNSWGIAIRGDFARAEAIASLGDLARYIAGGGRLKLACSIEFADSPAALPAFEAAYGFQLGQSQLLALAGGNTAATIRAAAEGTDGVNASMAYGTDGALAALGLILLGDDRHAQIVYQPAPVIRSEVLQRHPQIAQILAGPFQALTLRTLQRLNARIAVDGEDAKAVATDFLATNGFIR